MEVVVVLVLVTILSVVAAAALRNIQRESRSRTARAALETVAAGQEAYHLERGRWAISPEALASFSTGGLLVTASVSSGPSVVSVAEIVVDGQQALGAAVLDGNADCLTLAVLPPTDPGDQQIRRRPGATCEGAAAGLP